MTPDAIEFVKSSQNRREFWERAYCAALSSLRFETLDVVRSIGLGRAAQENLLGNLDVGCALLADAAMKHWDARFNKWNEREVEGKKS